MTATPPTTPKLSNMPLPEVLFSTKDGPATPTAVGVRDTIRRSDLDQIYGFFQALVPTMRSKLSGEPSACLNSEDSEALVRNCFKLLAFVTGDDVAAKVKDLGAQLEAAKAELATAQAAKGLKVGEAKMQIASTLQSKKGELAVATTALNVKVAANSAADVSDERTAVSGLQGEVDALTLELSMLDISSNVNADGLPTTFVLPLETIMSRLKIEGPNAELIAEGNRCVYDLSVLRERAYILADTLVRLHRSGNAAQGNITQIQGQIDTLNSVYTHNISKKSEADTNTRVQGLMLRIDTQLKILDEKANALSGDINGTKGKAVDAAALARKKTELETTRTDMNMLIAVRDRIEDRRNHAVKYLNVLEGALNGDFVDGLTVGFAGFSTDPYQYVTLGTKYAIDLKFTA